MIRPEETPSMPRREALRVIGRYVAAGGILAGAAWLAIADPTGKPPCVKTIACGDCGAFGTCGLEKARKT